MSKCYVRFEEFAANKRDFIPMLHTDDLSEVICA